MPFKTFCLRFTPIRILPVLSVLGWSRSPIAGSSKGFGAKAVCAREDAAGARARNFPVQLSNLDDEMSNRRELEAVNDLPPSGAR